MKRKTSDLRFLKWLILPCIALCTFFLTRIFIYTPQHVEEVYSQFLYPCIAILLSNISNLVPFSIDDLFYIFLFLTMVVLLVFLLMKRLSVKKAGKIIVNIFALSYILFYWLWGFNYFRSDMNTRFTITETEANTEKFELALVNLIEKTNDSFNSFDFFNAELIDSMVEDSYKKLGPLLMLDYPMGKRNPKNITFSRFFANAAISGYYGPFFNEVHINSFLLPVEYPMVLAHEKAHQFGITSEAEANFYAWLVCSKSKSERLQYSANLYVLKFFLVQAYSLDGYSDYVKMINEPVKEDYRKIQKHWMNLRNEKIDKVASQVNDAYLKTNNVQKGIHDYKGVVKLIMDFQADADIQNKLNELVGH